MTKFSVEVARCQLYEIEADDSEAAVKTINDAYYDDNLRDYEDQLVDFFPRFESRGEIDESEDEIDESEDEIEAGLA
jgi:hypothetical protein